MHLDPVFSTETPCFPPDPVFSTPRVFHTPGPRTPGPRTPYPGTPAPRFPPSRLGQESARALLCKLASCTRQIFLSKSKLLQTRQTVRKNKKLSKAEIGNSQVNSILEKKRELSCSNFIHKSKAYAYN